MTRADPIIDRIRAADPAGDIDLEAASRTPRAQRTLDDIVTDGGQRSGGRLSRRGFVAVVAAATLALSTVGAVAGGLFDPDPQDVQGILDGAEGAADAHGPGWRPTLDSEAVLCAYDSGDGASSTFASEFPLDEPLTVDRIVAECRTGSDAARVSGAPDDLTLCEGVQTRAAIQEQLASGEIVSGDVASRPSFPVVLGWDADCSTAAFTGSHDLELRDFTGVEDVNRAREVEVRLESLALDRCQSRDEAVQLAGEVVTALDRGWFVFDPLGHDSDEPCHRVDLDPMLGAIVIW